MSRALGSHDEAGRHKDMFVQRIYCLHNKSQLFTSAPGRRQASTCTALTVRAALAACNRRAIALLENNSSCAWSLEILLFNSSTVGEVQQWSPGIQTFFYAFGIPFQEYIRIYTYKLGIFSGINKPVCGWYVFGK